MQFYLHNGKMDDKTEKVAIHGRAQFNEKFVLQLKKNPMGNDDEATKSLLKIHNGAKIYILLDLNSCDVLQRFHIIYPLGTKMWPVYEVKCLRGLQFLFIKWLKNRHPKFKDLPF